MASFTKKVFGLAGAAITFAGMAFGQATCVGDPPQTNIIRAEGVTEQVGQLVIRCTNSSGAPTVLGTASLQVFLSPALPVTSKVIDTATGNTTAIAIVSGSATQVNATVSGSTLNFSSIALPVTAPGSSFTITVSNVRVNATSLSVGAGVPPAVSETAFITGSTGSITPAVIASQQVAFVQNGLGVTGVFTGVGSTTAGVNKNFNNCVAAAPGLSGVYRINENFTQAFKSAAEEADKVLLTASGQVTAISTRIKVSFANVPTGATIVLPVGALTSATGLGQITWVTSDTGTTAAAADSTVGAPSGTRAVALTSGAGSVTFSVIASDPVVLDKYDIPVYVVTTANSVTSTSGAFTVTSSFAPIASATAIPTFAVGSSTTTTNFSTFSQCSTSLLFPFVTNQLGFDTGIAISNTSTDPFGTKGATAQAGTCSLNFYGAGAPSPANVTTPNVPSGTTYTQVLSGVAAGFQGYLIAQCNFQFAHGFAFVTNGVGANGGLSQGYLAGVIPDVNQVVRLANDASKAISGSGETLGN